MATIKHLKVSAIPDAGDDTLIEPSDWNNDHVLTGTVEVANGGTGATTLTGYVKGTGTTAMTAASTIPNTDITGLGTASTKDAGVALGVATLDAGGKVPVSELPAAVLGALSYQGTWNASTNSPTLTSSVGTKGYYYVVSVAGSTDLNGITDWLVGDWAVFNGSVWQKIDNTETVTSVNGQVGAVVLTQTDISGTVPTSRTLTAGTGLTGGGDLSANRTFAIDSTVATLTGTQTLTNKTLTSPLVNEILDTNGNEILGLSPTTSATDFLTVKNGIGVGVPLHLYADGSSTNVGLHIQPKGSGLVTISDGTDFNKGIRFRSSGSAASAVTLLDAVATAGRVVTLPDATTTLVGRDTTDTLTNKSISGSTNTLSNIGNSSLTNSAITINGTSTSLGGSISVGTVTSVAATVPSFLSVAGSPITTSGTLALTYSGTALPIANGGTGQTTANTAFNALAPSQTANSGKYLTTDGTNTSWSTVGGNAYTRTSFTATAAQTTFTVTYTAGYVEVYVNGVLLNGADYTASNGTTVVLGVACNSGDIVETIAFNTFSVANTVSSFSGGSTGLTPSTATTGAVSLAGTLATANGGTGLTTVGTVGQVLTTDGTSLSYGSSIVSGTAVDSTSGTAVTFTSIPSWVKRITMVLNGVSTSGSSYFALRIGSGSIDTTSYVSSSTVCYGVNLASTQGTASYVIYSDVASNALSGSIQLNNISGNIWIASGTISIYAVNAMITLGGTHTTSSTLDRVQLTTINGTDTFDAGSVNILYE
jgi:hypothetical protein